MRVATARSGGVSDVEALIGRAKTRVEENFNGVDRTIVGWWIRACREIENGVEAEAILCVCVFEY